MRTKLQGQPMVAIVDDDESIRHTTKDLLESAGFCVATFDSAEGLLQTGDLDRVACLITDIRMPGMSGFELVERLRALGRAIPTILITAYADERMRAQAVKARVIGFLAKPFTAEDLLACLRIGLGPHNNGTP